MIDALVPSVGTNHRDMSYRNVALLLEPKIIDGSLWANTAWSGGRSVSPESGSAKKIAFIQHIVFRSFFSDAIKKNCGSPIPDGEMISYIQSRTRNSSYSRTSSRTPSARKRMRRTVEQGQQNQDQLEQNAENIDDENNV